MGNCNCIVQKPKRQSRDDPRTKRKPCDKLYQTDYPFKNTQFRHSQTTNNHNPETPHDKSNPQHTHQKLGDPENLKNSDADWILKQRSNIGQISNPKDPEKVNQVIDFDINQMLHSNVHKHPRLKKAYSLPADMTTNQLQNSKEKQAPIRESGTSQFDSLMLLSQSNAQGKNLVKSGGLNHQQRQKFSADNIRNSLVSIIIPEQNESEAQHPTQS